MERVIVTRPFLGITSGQVCAVADATDEEILREANRLSPPGTSNGWGKVVRENDKDYPNSAPVVCADHPERKHFVIIC